MKNCFRILLLMSLAHVLGAQNKAEIKLTYAKLEVLNSFDFSDTKDSVIKGPITKTEKVFQGYLVKTEMQLKSVACDYVIHVKIGSAQNGAEFYTEDLKVFCEDFEGRTMYSVVSTNKTAAKRGRILSDYLIMNLVVKEANVAKAKWVTVSVSDVRGTESEKSYYELKVH